MGSWLTCCEWSKQVGSWVTCCETLLVCCTNRLTLGHTASHTLASIAVCGVVLLVTCKEENALWPVLVGPANKPMQRVTAARYPWALLQRSTKYQTCTVVMRCPACAAISAVVVLHVEHRPP